MKPDKGIIHLKPEDVVINGKSLKIHGIIKKCKRDRKVKCNLDCALFIVNFKNNVLRISLCEKEIIIKGAKKLINDKV